MKFGIGKAIYNIVKQKHKRQTQERTSCQDMTDYTAIRNNSQNSEASDSKDIFLDHCGLAVYSVNFVTQGSKLMEASFQHMLLLSLRQQKTQITCWILKFTFYLVKAGHLAIPNLSGISPVLISKGKPETIGEMVLMTAIRNPCGLC